MQIYIVYFIPQYISFIFSYFTFDFILRLHKGSLSLSIVNLFFGFQSVMNSKMQEVACPFMKRIIQLFFLIINPIVSLILKNGSHRSKDAYLSNSVTTDSRSPDIISPSKDAEDAPTHMAGHPKGIKKRSFSRTHTWFREKPLIYRDGDDDVISSWSQPSSPSLPSHSPA